jgi:hypothetical protein
MPLRHPIPEAQLPCVCSICGTFPPDQSGHFCSPFHVPAAIHEKLEPQGLHKHGEHGSRACRSSSALLKQTVARQRVSDTQAQLVQLFGHPWATITALAQSVLVADMRQNHHVAPLPMGYRPPLTVCRQTVAGQRVFPSPKAAIRDPHHAAGMRPGKGSPIAIQKRELHGFWAAKNCVAFFSSSLHSPGKQSPRLFSYPAQTFRIRFSRRSRSFSRKRFWSGSGGPDSSETILTHLFRVERPPLGPLLRNALPGNEPPNQTQPDASSGHWSARCEPHPA